MGYMYEKSLAIMKCKNNEEKIAMDNMFTVVEQMIKEEVMQYVEKYMNEYKDRMILEIAAMINGKVVNLENLGNMIRDVIVKKLNN